MKQIYLKLSVLLLFVMVGVSSAWAGTEKGTIKFGTNDIKISSSNVTGNDNLENTWRITTVGTSSFTSNASYYQVGSSNAPATSITFTTTLQSAVNITSMSAKFGGFSGTAGTVTLKVGETTIGTGTLNATNDVTVSSTKSETGTVLTITVTGISKGVKCYNISYTYDVEFPTYTIKWSVNSDVTKTETLEEGTDIMTPTVDNIYGKTFIGWTTSEVSKSNDKPILAEITKAKEDITYYAVFCDIIGKPYYQLTNTLTEGKTYVFASSNSEGKCCALNGKGLGSASNGNADAAKEIAIENEGDNIIIKTLDDDIEFKFNGGNDFDVMASTSNEKLVINGNGIGKATTNYKAYWDDDKGLYGTNSRGTTNYYVNYVSKFNAADNTKGRVYAFEKQECKFLNYCTTINNSDYTIITINSACTDGTNCYSTFSSSSAFIVPEGLTVSTVGVDDNKLVVNNYSTGDVVAANTGVMVSGTAGDHAVALTTETATEIPGTNNLHPSSEQMTGDNLFYRLTMHNGTKIGYWWGAEEGAAFDLAANKAYLAVPKDAKVKSNFWFGGETAISAPVVKIENEVIYNLNGQRVSSATKGLYIKNGKKYLVK